VSEASELALATKIGEELAARGIEPLVIGAAALAVHGYPRFTEDLDFGVAIPPAQLRDLAAALSDPEREVSLVESDPSDPLGGVITITQENSLKVQVVNFDNSPAGGFPALVRGAQERASAVPDVPGKVTSIEDLVLFKLYAGGPKSELDILELLTRVNVDLPTLKTLAKGYRMDRDLETLLARVNL
jgi:hypothetical protein